VKLAATALMLAIRRERAELFAEGGYRPIEIAGEDGDWGFGFLREQGSERLAVVVARYPAKRAAKPGWDATAKLPDGRWFDAFRGRVIEPGAPMRDWLGPLPVAVLTQA
jgi:(1->4)-alpha-D-glucan 1-alpha-D-glucosylmutase